MAMVRASRAACPAACGIVRRTSTYKAFAAMPLERFDAIVLGILIVVMIRAPSDFVRIGAMVASLMLVLLMAWRHRK